jgi:hypothetical protein
MAKPCGFAIEFNPLGTPPLSLYSSHSSTRNGAPRAGANDEVAGGVLRPVPSPRRTTTVLWGGEGGPGAGALVQAAHVDRSLVQAALQAAVRPGAVLRRLRARPSDACTHLCADPELLWVCGMEQGWAILQVEHPPTEVVHLPV